MWLPEKASSSGEKDKCKGSEEVHVQGIARSCARPEEGEQEGEW